MFVIIALILVFAIIIIFISKPDIIDFDRVRVDSEVQPIYSFVESCVEQTVENAVNHIGDNGGYFISPESSLDNEIPVYFDKGNVEVLSLDEIEMELSKYVNQMLFFCTRNFVDFPNFEVRQEEIKSVVNVEEYLVSFDIDYSLSIAKGDESFVLKDFDIEVPVNLLGAHNASLEIVTVQEKYPSEICLTCIEKIAMDNKMIIEMRDYQDARIFSIVDASSGINGQEFIFYFAERLEE